MALLLTWLAKLPWHCITRDPQMCQKSTSRVFAKCGTILTLGQEANLSTWTWVSYHEIRPCLTSSSSIFWWVYAAPASFCASLRPIQSHDIEARVWPWRVHGNGGQLHSPLFLFLTLDFMLCPKRNKWFLSRYLTDVLEAQGGCVLPRIKKQRLPEASKGSHLPSSFPPPVCVSNERGGVRRCTAWVTGFSASRSSVTTAICCCDSSGT